MEERPHSIRGGPGSIPGRCSSIFGIWREVGITGEVALLGRNPSHHLQGHNITITYRYIMYFFRTFKKSTVPYKVHNMGLQYKKRVFLHAIHGHHYYGFYSPPPFSKSGLKLVCNVNVEYGNLMSQNSQLKIMPRNLNKNVHS
jgi:hypothetical protein